jgi:hypothetical protein
MPQPNATPDLLPGERYDAKGARFIFDYRLYNGHRNSMAVANAPADLSSLPLDGDEHGKSLRSLMYAALSRSGHECPDFTAGCALVDRITAEYARRGLDSMGRSIAANCDGRGSVKTVEAA